MSANNILLVEGNNDKALLQKFCERLPVSVKIQVAVPKDFSGYFNTKGGVFNLLPTMLKQLEDGSLQRFGAIVDADYAAHHGLGYRKTLDRFKAEVLGRGFYEKPRNEANGGSIFGHNDGLRDIGLWIMPDNMNDGMVEHWISNTIGKTQQSLYCYAQSVVAAVPQPVLFKSIHIKRAEVATLMAWQKIPGQGLEHCVSDNIVDIQHVLVKRLVDWLENVFGK